VVPDVSKECNTCIFKVQAFQDDGEKKTKERHFFLDCLTVEVEGTVFL